MEEGEREKLEVFVDKKILEEVRDLMKTSEYKTMEEFIAQALKLMLFSEKTKSMFSNFPQIISKDETQKSEKAHGEEQQE